MNQVGLWLRSGSDHAFDVSPPLNRTAEVIERRGCDLQPVDPTSDEGALTLRSFIWADQLARLALLDGAISVAREMPVEVERLDATSFLERELDRCREGAATIVFHSVMMQFVDEAGRSQIRALIDHAEKHATRNAPVFHLGMESGKDSLEVRLGEELLAVTRAHGTGVVWLAP